MKRNVALAALLFGLLLAAACGQKSGVYEPSAAPAGQGAQAAVPAAPSTPDSTGPTTMSPPGVGVAPQTPAGPSVSTPAPSAPSSGAAAAPRPSARPGQPAGSGGAAPAPGGASGPAPAPSAPSAPGGGTAPAPGAAAAPAPAGPVDRTGVTDKLIKIGIHAPVTGAAPFPQNAFDKGKDVYWKFLAEKGGVHGRNVQVIFRDDQFNPSRAVQVCREMVEQEKVFVLLGAAGSDQITACARYANAVGIPYLSAGVNEDGLTGQDKYFAVSMTYAQQSPLLTGFIKNKLGKSKLAIVINDTPALNETLRSITAAAQQSGLNIVRSSRIGKNASDSELLSEANQLRTSGAEVVYILTSPVNFIKLATNAQAQAYNPTYLGPGITNGINIVAEAGCPSIGAAKFLSPFPQLDVIDKLDPDYKPAYTKYAGGTADDIGLAEWGINKVLHKMFDAVGPDLSRQSFLAALTSGREFISNVYPTVSFSATNRFGAKTMHLLEADCSSRTYKTIAQFASGF